MERLGLELDGAPCLLQPRLLARLGESLPLAVSCLSAASDHVVKPARLRRQLALSPAKLQAPGSSNKPPGTWSWKSAEQPATGSAIEAWHAQPAQPAICP